jgi:hypothetical protein
LFHINDHIGLVVPNLDDGEFLLGSWGARYYYCTDLKGNIRSKRLAPCVDDMEHQDAQLIHGYRAVGDTNRISESVNNRSDVELHRSQGEGTMMLVTGVTAERMDYFGLDLVDVTNWDVTVSLRWRSAQHLTKGGWPPFANPTFLWVDSQDRVLALAAPDCDDELMGKDTALALYALTRHQSAQKERGV